MNLSLLLSFLLMPFQHTSSVADAACACQIYIPNAFSPNGDGRNDGFRPFPGVECTFSSYDLKVFDRWGALVFAANNIDQEWDGEYKGEPAPASVYLYVLTYTLEGEGRPIRQVETGDLALLR
ncbi:MAG: gliding motility-associated C-terminal domain-containing protein [Lewinellaceae bacterium]|nr:gliding motility-associated C-terminal domain-containing protein [Lewinellaceae bacterium]